MSDATCFVVNNEVIYIYLVILFHVLIWTKVYRIQPEKINIIQTTVKQCSCSDYIALHIAFMNIEKIKINSVKNVH